MIAAIHKISVGGGGKHTLSPEESPRPKRKFWETMLTIERVNTRAITTAMTLKNAYSNASFSSVTAAIKSLGLSDNGFKTTAKHFEVGVPQKSYARALRCYTAGPFHICFLRSWNVIISMKYILKLDLQGMYLYDSGVHAYIHLQWRFQWRVYSFYWACMQRQMVRGPSIYASKKILLKE